MNERVTNLVQQSQWSSEIGQEQPPHQANLTLMQRDVAIVPFYDPLLHVAKAYPMRARVVAANGETIHVDAWGRIKVRFLFTRRLLIQATHVERVLSFALISLVRYE